MDVLSYVMNKNYTDELKYKVVKHLVSTQEPQKPIGHTRQVSGYGVASIPSNAKGQVSVTVKGNTETDEEGNTKSTIGSARIKSVGKNLFDKDMIIPDKLIGIEGSIWNSDDGRFVSGWIPISPNTKYQIRGRSLGKSAQRIGFYADKNLNCVLSVISSDVVTFTSPENARWLLITGYQDDVDIIQLERGDTATEYEPYKETVAYLPNVVLRSLPNGVKDEINVSEGKLIQRIGLDYSDVDNPTFTRNSVACLSDGTQVAANQPRFEDGPFAGKKAIMIEERTTNLFPADRRWAFNAEWTSDTLNGTYTVSIHGGTGKLVLSGGATGEVVAGQSLTFSVSNATVIFTPVDGTPERCQLERKWYATSFADGTRAAENLLIQNNGILNPQEGTIECWAWFPTFQEMRVRTLLRTTPSVNGKYLEFGLGNYNLQLHFWDTKSADKYLFGRAGSVYSNNWHYYVIKWGSFGTKVIVDDYTEINTTLQIHPDALSTQYIRLGSYDNVYNYMNGFIADLRISSIARTDEEILATYQSGQPLSVDAYTTYKVNFDGDLTAQRAKSLTYQLATPIISKVDVVGGLVAYPNGHIFTEPCMWGFMTEPKKVVTTPDLPIQEVRKVIRYDISENGKLIETDVTADVTAGDNNTSLTIANFERCKVYFYDCSFAQEVTTQAEIVADVEVDNGVVTHDYGASAADWVLDSNESKATMLVCTNAGGAAKIIAPATEGKMYIVKNNSGQTITIKTASSMGVTVANEKTATVVYYDTDFIKLSEV